MTPKTKKIVRWGSAVVGLIWIGAVGIAEFNDVGITGGGSNFRDKEIQKRLAKCSGSFKKRYDCKSSILRAAGADSFNYWGKKYGITFGPAIFLYVSFHIWLRRVEWGEERERCRLRLIRIEKKRQKESRFAKEAGRQRTMAAKRRQAVRQAEKDAEREEMDRPLNVMFVTQDREFSNSIAGPLFKEGYNVVQTDLRDVFLSYKEIGYHIILSDTKFRRPKVHPEDKKDPDFPGHPKPLKEALEQLKKQKENVRIVSISEDYVSLDADGLVDAAIEMDADAAIGKPCEISEMVELFNDLMGVGEDDDDDFEEASEEESEIYDA